MPPRNILVIFFSAVISLTCYYHTERDRDAAVIYSTLQLIDRNYFEPIERQELFGGALQGMVEQLDEHSAYLPPAEFQDIQENLDQQFGGVGIHVGLDRETERLMVLSPLVGTPAHAAGMRAGDLILAIDGLTTEGMSLKDAVDLMRGLPGQPVQLQIQHADDDEPLELTIVRDLIHIESVLGDIRRDDGAWSFVLQDHPDIGYVRLTTFGERTADELISAIETIEPRIKALILDVRGNAGGLLQTAVAVCDAFIEEGRIIVSTVGRGGVERGRFTAQAPPRLDSSIPVVVLTDRYSASASEIVSACLQDHRRAVVVGERTWGKGTVQNVIELEGGRGALKLTTAGYWRPSGKNIHRSEDATEDDVWGVLPNEGLEVKLTDAEFAELLRYRYERDFQNIAELQGPGNEEAEAPGEEATSGERTPPGDAAGKGQPGGSEQHAPSEDAAGSDDEPLPPDFKDPHIEKAVEYLKGRLPKTTPLSGRA